MTKKILIIIIIILIPIYIISFPSKTNFIMSEKGIKPVYVNFNNEKIELEEYVYHVVAAEIPASFEEEAIKAQILATRTYTYNKIYNDSKYEFSIKDQAYHSDEELKNKWQNNYEKYQKKIKELILETKGEIVTYKNEPIKAYYFSMSNGYTSNALEVFGTNEEYLTSVISEDENKLPNFSITKTFSINEIASKLNIALPLTITNIKRDNTHRVTKITINNQEYSGTDVRKILNLRSTDFEISVVNNEVNITTIGYGHGVGMSQYGANILAKKGFNYKDIIKKYYTNTEIKKIGA